MKRLQTFKTWLSKRHHTEYKLNEMNQSKINIRGLFRKHSTILAHSKEALR